MVNWGPLPCDALNIIIMFLIIIYNSTLFIVNQLSFLTKKIDFALMGDSAKILLSQFKLKMQEEIVQQSNF